MNHVDFFVTHDLEESSTLVQASCKATLRYAIDFLVDRNVSFECSYPYINVLDPEDAASLVSYLRESHCVFTEYKSAFAVA